jgi:hypothetical protein
MLWVSLSRKVMMIIFQILRMKIMKTDILVGLKLIPEYNFKKFLVITKLGNERPEIFLLILTTLCKRLSRNYKKIIRKKNS